MTQCISDSWSIVHRAPGTGQAIPIAPEEFKLLRPRKLAGHPLGFSAVPGHFRLRASSSAVFVTRNVTEALEST